MSRLISLLFLRYDPFTDLPERINLTFSCTNISVNRAFHGQVRCRDSPQMIPAGWIEFPGEPSFPFDDAGDRMSCDKEGILYLYCIPSHRCSFGEKDAHTVVAGIVKSVLRSPSK